MTNLLNAALPPTATFVPTTDLHLLPAGLTDLDTARIGAAIAAARNESTRRPTPCSGHPPRGWPVP